MLQLNVICMVLWFYQLPSCRLNWLNFLGHGESDLHLQCKSKSHCPWTNLKMTCTSYILGRSAVADLTMDARWSNNVLQETFSENLCFGCIHLQYICIYIYTHIYLYIYIYTHISIVQLSSFSSYFVIFSFGLPSRFVLLPRVNPCKGSSVQCKESSQCLCNWCMWPVLQIMIFLCACVLLYHFRDTFDLTSEVWPGSWIVKLSITS